MKKIITFLACCLSSVMSFGQTACDSLNIDVRYAAFSDSLIEISVTNTGTSLFSYPGFIIFNANGDTVAKEDVNLFGMGSSSSHVLKIYPGMVTTPVFTGTLQLWSGFFSTLECSYSNMSFNLCPDTCVTVYPFIGNMGGATSLGTVSWTLQDSLAATVASGTLTLDNINQIAFDTVCLNPGLYMLHIAGISTPMQGQPYVGITSNYPNSPNPQMPYPDAAMQLPFTLFGKCPLMTSVAKPPVANRVRIFSNGGVVSIAFVQGKQIGDIGIYSIAGARVWTGVITKPTERIDLSHLPTGIYIVRAKNEGNFEHLKVYIEGQ